MTRWQLAIFDLDGVLADTAGLHYHAWKAIADRLGITFSEADNEALKGVDRMGSLRTILALGRRELPDGQLTTLADGKNDLYLQGVERLSPADLLPGANDLLAACRNQGLGLAVASASRNAPRVLDRLGLADTFDFVADPATSRPKPAPDLFLSCSDALGAAPARCIAFEDAAAGVAAINAAGMRSIGIGTPAVLRGACLIFPTIGAVALADCLR